MTRKVIDPGELPEVKALLAGLASGAHAATGPGLPAGESPGYDFPAWRTWFHCPGPQVLVRYPDGTWVEFRPGWDDPGWAPRSRCPQVHGQGVTVRGVRLDIDVMLGEDLSWSSGWIWLSDARGAAFGEPADKVPGRVREAAVALCRRRAREAREALGVAAGYRHALKEAGGG